MEKENVTLEDLREKPVAYKSDESLNDLKEVSIESIAPYKKENEEGASIMDDIFGEIDNGINRIAQQSVEFIKENEEKILQEELEEEMGEDTLEEEVEEETFKPDTEEENKTIVFNKYEIDEEDLEDEIDEEESIGEREENDKQIEKLKMNINEKIKPVIKKIDLSTFTISKKPISVNNALKSSVSSDSVVNWGLFESKIPITMKEFKGYEIGNLDIRNQVGISRYNGYKNIYGNIFDHIHGTKPKTLEEWLKAVSFFDIPHLFFSIYMASFKDANYIPYNCTNPDCKETFISDNINLEDMVKYDSEEIKNHAMEIINKEYNEEDISYEVTLEQISDNYVFGFKEPSIFNILFENSILDEKFTSKYSDLLAIISFIDQIYVIDFESEQLRPVEIEVDPDNLRKTVKSKVVRYAKIIKTLNSDQIHEIESITRKIQEKHEKIHYVIPECKCTKCGTVIKETEIGSEDLLFTRHQLKSIANS